MKETHILLDARGLFLHSYHSGEDVDGGKDENGRKLHSAGHTLHNFVDRYLTPITKHFAPRQIIAVWDAGNKYRKNIFAEYKAKRHEGVSDALRAAQNEALVVARRFFDAFGVTQVEVPDVEADDVIAYLVSKLSSPKIVHTVDADLIQLASDTCSVWIRGEPVEAYRPEPDVHISPRLVALYKALVGDTSDGYKGIKGFGPNAFAELLATYGEDGLLEMDEALKVRDFSPIIQAIESEEPGKHPLLEKIMKGSAEVKQCYALATLWPSLAEQTPGFGFTRPAWRKRLPSRKAMTELLQEIGCEYLMKDLSEHLPQRWILDSRVWEPEVDVAEAAKIFAESPAVAIDFETWAPENHAFKAAARGDSFVDVLGSRITGMGITFGRNYQHTMYVTVDHRDSANLPKDVLLQILDQIPNSVPIVAHNAMFERTVLLNEMGADLTELRDTRLLASHVEEAESKHLKDLSKRWLDYDQVRYKDVVPEGKTMRDLSVEAVFAYGADDPFVTAHLYDLFNLITECEGTRDFCEQNEYPSIYPISDAYLAGVEIDWEELARQGKEDQVVYERSMERLRDLLEKNQTEEHVAAGAKALFDEGEKTLRAQAAAQGWAQDLVERDGQHYHKLDIKLYDLALATQDRARYSPFTQMAKEVKFKPTPSQLTKVTALLGLPPIEKLTNKYLTIYAQSHLKAGAPSPDAGAFLNMLGFARSKKKNELDEFTSLCLAVLQRSMSQDKLFDKQGDELNLDSPKQMVDLLYGKLALPIRHRNFKISATRKDLGLEDGGLQADENAIRMAIVMDTPEGDWRREALLALIEARKAHTRGKMFYHKYPLWKHPHTGLVHPSINSAGTETRRPTGSSPNPLQWPKKNEGVKFRRCILPNSRFGHDLIVSLDWDQEELRFAAGLSLDPELSSCYIGSDVAELLPPWVREFYSEEQLTEWLKSPTRDVHSLTGSGIAKVAYGEFLKAIKDENHPEHKRMAEIRRGAKAVNFGGAYGIGAGMLARGLLSSVQTAQEYLDAKHQLYEGFEKWKAGVVKEAQANGYVTTLLGTRRHVYADINSDDTDKRKSIERQLINFLIQGLAADVLKQVLRGMYAQQTLQRHPAVLIAPIYDEVVFSVHHNNAVGLIREVHELMTRPIPGLPIPILSSVSLGRNFGDQIELGTQPTDEQIWKAMERVLEMREAA